MVSLLLGEGANLVGKGQCVGEAPEVEEPLDSGDAVALQQLPVGDLAPELRDLRLGHQGESRRQATHRSADSILIARTSSGPPGGSTDSA